MTALHQTKSLIAAAVLLFAALPLSHAARINDLIAANPDACGTLTSTQIEDLKLVARAQEGTDAFTRHVRFHTPYRGWTMEQAVARAEAAAGSRCALAIGFKPLDQTEVASLFSAPAR